MTTLTQLADIIQTALSDTAETTYTQIQIESWVIEAIKDYSLHFPLTAVSTIPTIADQTTYTLPTGHQTTLQVEYPTGDDPPTYLHRLNINHTAFWLSPTHYHIIKHNDAQTADQLVISPKPVSEASTLTITHQADHPHDLQPTDPVTITPHHHNLITAFVVWKAAQHLQMKEQQAPTSNSSLLMSQLASNAARLHAEYNTALGRAIYNQPMTNTPLQWQPTDHGRIY